jgi:hypothetical protein
MLQPIIAHASQALYTFFDAEETNQAALQAGFTQRQSKLDGITFLQTLVLGFLQHPQGSLNQLSQVSRDLGVEISPQGIDERLNQAAIRFLKERLVAALVALRAKHAPLAGVLEGFSEVYFQDSTIQSLSESLQTLFPGSGGDASPAAIKIQLLFAFWSGNIEHLEWEAGRSPDTGYLAHLAHLLPGSLLLQDLGFFNLSLFQAVVDSSAFFLSRWRPDVQVYLADQPEQPVDLQTFLPNQKVPLAAYSVFLGQTAHLACRLVCVRLPPAVAAQRRRRLRVDAIRRGRLISKRRLRLCDWNVFVTNVPEDKLSLQQLLACYSLRWQVELIFKLWKSQAGLKRVAEFRPERALGELYAKLIVIAITHFLIAPLRFLLIEQQVEISPPKAWQILQDRAKDLTRAIGRDLQSTQAELEELIHRILRFARKNKRKKHLSSYNRLRLANELHIFQLYPLA